MLRFRKQLLAHTYRPLANPPPAADAESLLDCGSASAWNNNGEQEEGVDGDFLLEQLWRIEAGLSAGPEKVD